LIHGVLAIVDCNRNCPHDRAVIITCNVVANWGLHRLTVPFTRERPSAHPKPFGDGRRAMIMGSSGDVRLPEGRVIGSLCAATTASVQRRSLHGIPTSQPPQPITGILGVSRLACQRRGATPSAISRLLPTTPAVKSQIDNSAVDWPIPSFQPTRRARQLVDACALTVQRQYPPFSPSPVTTSIGPDRGSAGCETCLQLSAQSVY
jgi:hypothetical protein